MMFKVICIAIKLLKHWKTSKYEEIHVEKCRILKKPKKASENFPPMLSYVEFSADFEFDIEKL